MISEKLQNLLQNRKLVVVAFPYHNPDLVAQLKERYARDRKPIYVSVKKEPENKYDENALAAFYGSKRIGYVVKEEAYALRNEPIIKFNAGMIFYTDNSGVLIPFGNSKPALRKKVKAIPITEVDLFFEPIKEDELNDEEEIEEDELNDEEEIEEDELNDEACGIGPFGFGIFNF